MLEQVDESASHALLRLSQPSLVLTPAEQLLCHRLVAAGAIFLKQRAVEFLQQHAGEPVAISYQSDSTPETTFERIHVGIGERRVCRGGRQTSEFLLGRLYMVFVYGTRHVLFRAPFRLAVETGWTHLAAATYMLLYLFTYGSMVVNVFHAVVDGPLFSTLSDLLYRHHRKAIVQHTLNMETGDATLCRLRNWFVST